MSLDELNRNQEAKEQSRPEGMDQIGKEMASQIMEEQGIDEGAARREPGELSHGIDDDAARRSPEEMEQGIDDDAVRRSPEEMAFGVDDGAARVSQENMGMETKVLEPQHEENQMKCQLL